MHSFPLFGLFVTNVGHALMEVFEDDGCCKVVIDFDIFGTGLLNCLG